MVAGGKLRNFEDMAIKTENAEKFIRNQLKQGPKTWCDLMGALAGHVVNLRELDAARVRMKSAGVIECKNRFWTLTDRG